MVLIALQRKDRVIPRIANTDEISAEFSRMLGRFISIFLSRTVFETLHVPKAPSCIGI